MNASLRIKDSRYFLKPIYQAMLSAGIVFLATIPYVNAEDTVLQEVEVTSAKEDSSRKDKGYQAKKVQQPLKQIRFYVMYHRRFQWSRKRLFKINPYKV